MNSTQIAKLAGVSRSTVSKVLHNYKGIPEETRQRVLKLIKEYDYKPNSMSQALKGISPKVIGLYFYDCMTEEQRQAARIWISQYNMAMLDAITMEAKKLGYSLLYEQIYKYESEQKLEDMVNEAFSSHKICSAIFIGLDSEVSFVSRLAKPGRHIIVLDKEMDTTTGVRCLFSNDFRSAERSCEHLYENGFKRVLHISGDTTKLSGFDRRRGYLSFIHKLKMQCMEEGKLEAATPAERDSNALGCEALVIDGNFSMESGYQAGLRYINEKLFLRYDGISCGCDMIAIGFIKCLREHCPELLSQIGIIGFDDEVVDQYISPSLSTMSPNYRSFAHMILDLEQNYEEFKGGMSLKLDHELIERDSSKPLSARGTGL